eukprot:Plantae.Rhodophyta-Hildenbrandia_rubra.ctg2172.p2 GENE.Plantae.Rhodophyta-Hildenbrandia_rubra.ctg2172~~Plantae.Rhodophyta-Hildenbrandia_rubra.ctg2172.p2  ORF type:complete len:351 (+),score=78.23 Plantae.Rhodophyta-Hildenbrandia_rubra.ctg2172:240-1292(+)
MAYKDVVQRAEALALGQGEVADVGHAIVREAHIALQHLDLRGGETQPNPIYMDVQESVTNNVKGSLDEMFDNMFDKMAKKMTETMDQKFGAMEQKMDQRFGEMDKKFGEMDKKFDEMDQKFGEMDQKFDEMDQKFDEMDQKFDNMDGKIEALDTKIEDRFDGLCEELGELYANIQEPNLSTNLVRATLIDIVVRLDGVDSQIDSLHGLVRESINQNAGLREIVNGIPPAIGDISKDAVAVEGAVVEILDKIDIIAKQLGLMNNWSEGSSGLSAGNLSFIKRNEISIKNINARVVNRNPDLLEEHDAHRTIRQILKENDGIGGHIPGILEGQRSEEDPATAVGEVPRNCPS